MGSRDEVLFAQLRREVTVRGMPRDQAARVYRAATGADLAEVRELFREVQPERAPVDWRGIAYRLAGELAAHAFCERHRDPARPGSGCPWCENRAAYLAYLEAGGRDFRPQDPRGSVMLLISGSGARRADDGTPVELGERRPGEPE